MRIPQQARLHGGLFFLVWIIGLSTWTGFFVAAHHLWPLGRLIRLIVIGMINAGALMILRTPLPHQTSTRFAPSLTLSTTTTTGLVLAGSCVGGVCTLPLAGFWALPWMNTLIIADTAWASWILRLLTGIVVLLAFRHVQHWRTLTAHPVREE
ncbi:hypothetical protein [Sulfobacillus thermosulfidooxidans]|uniref:hypothetical protein n=1 Tax=Sulfobacillus thermosulfidooxidans TaxID=28034 RepID=UPI0006B4873C|nr:hypothetical protein [Sulfobacillus thermosulfidooxidans]